MRSPPSSELWKPGRREPRGSTRQPPVSPCDLTLPRRGAGRCAPAWLPLSSSTDGTAEPHTVHSGHQVSGTRPTGLRGLLGESPAGATPVLWGCRLRTPSAISRAPASCGEGLGAEPALRRRWTSQEGKPGWSGPHSVGGNGLAPHTGPARGCPAGPSPAHSTVQEETDGRAGSAPRMYARARRQAFRWPRRRTSAWRGHTDGASGSSGTHGHADENTSEGEEL